jgi:hypothetical protein
MSWARATVIACVAALAGACSSDRTEPSCETVAEHLAGLQAADRSARQLAPLDGDEAARRRSQTTDRCERDEVSREVRVCLMGASTREAVAACTGP